MLRQIALLAQAVLADVQHFARGPDWRARFRSLGGGCRNVFELESHHVDARRELTDRIQIVVGCRHFQVCDLPGGRIFIG